MTPATDALSLLASRAAVRQYRLAARLHARAADDLQRRGWQEWADALVRISETLTAAADAEKVGGNG